MRWHMARCILLIALVLSRWPLTTDTQTQEPSLTGKQLIDGRVCSQFPNLCAYALNRCILKKYFLKKFRCPSMIIQKTTDAQTTNQETVSEVSIVSMTQSVAEVQDTITTAATTAESLPVLITEISTSPIAQAEVSPEPSPTNVALTTAIETSDIVITPITTTTQSLLVTATNMLESLPEHPTVPDAVIITTEPVPELMATTTAVPIITSLQDSTTAESFLESLVTTTTTGSVSMLTIISPIASTSPPAFASSPTQSETAMVDIVVGATSPQQNSVGPASTQQHKETAGHLESQVSLVTLNGQPQKETSQTQQGPLHGVNFKELFHWLQGNQVQRLIQEAQVLLAKGKGKEKGMLQDNSLQMLRALSFVNSRKKDKLSSKIKSQE